ncbi:Efflux pump membrane transporter BepG [Raoultella terrigena]|uniref:Efflux pump membrane transporter BepG n=1 Tax=Raoultella terrigena TaxID=577 RepID=A0A485B6U9_RAOTE|nr:Efflux pump membrane transporter BepG [Raoultella terrigena]
MLTFFIRRPRFAMVIALLITFAGAVALKLIPVEQYPQITPPVVSVSASWPGASAADVAEAIAAPLETQLNGVDHMLYMESTSSDEGTYSLSLTFAAGTDADLAAIDVQNRVSQAVAQLPAEVQQNGVQVRKRATNLLMGISLYSPTETLSPLFVSNYASTQVREALARLPGRRRGADVRRPRLQHARLAASGSHECAERHQRRYRPGAARAERAGRRRAGGDAAGL